VSDQARTDVGAAEARGLGAAQDAENVELRFCQSAGFEGLVEAPLELVGGALQVQNGLGFETFEGALLSNFFCEFFHDSFPVEARRL
jgi:hypothetical protein